MRPRSRPKKKKVVRALFWLVLFVIVIVVGIILYPFLKLGGKMGRGIRSFRAWFMDALGVSQGILWIIGYLLAEGFYRIADFFMGIPWEIRMRRMARQRKE